MSRAARWRASWRALTLGGMVALCWATNGAAWAVTTSGGAPSCESLAAEAARRHGLPPGLLQAVALTETGRTVGGDYRAWPWAINVAGRGHYPDSRAEALAMARELEARGARLFDLGCMQINYRWHAEAFDSLEDMLDPAVNTDYAARYLARLHRREGSWEAAIRRYHSADPDRGAAYLERVRRHLERLGHGDRADRVESVASAAKQGTGQRRAMAGARDGRFTARAPLVALGAQDKASGLFIARLPEGALPRPIKRAARP